MPQDDVQLVPGARIAGGRYRLLVFHGGAPPLQFWQALDTALDRQGVLTFLDPGGGPPQAVRPMQSLPAAADTAHRSGVALSIDHPSRVRVSIEGDVVLAYPATMPDANPEDDIRGIGASLYALLVNRWPLPEFGVRSGLAPADRDASGLPVEPNNIDRDIPFQISAVAVRAVQEDGGIRSASTLLNLL